MMSSILKRAKMKPYLLAEASQGLFSASMADKSECADSRIGAGGGDGELSLAADIL